MSPISGESLGEGGLYLHGLPRAIERRCALKAHSSETTFSSSRSLFDRQVIEPRIEQVVRGASDKALEDPDGAQLDLEALANTYPHAESYTALLKFYRLRRAPSEDTLKVAEKLWRASQNSTDPILASVIQEHFSAATAANIRHSRDFMGFVENVWNSGAVRDPRVGLELGDAFLQTRWKRKAGVQILKDSVDLPAADDKTAVQVLRIIGTREAEEVLPEILEKIATKVSEELLLLTLADIAIQNNSTPFATAAVDSGFLSLEALRELSAPRFIGVSLLTGAPRSDRAALAEEIVNSARVGPAEALEEIGAIYVTLGATDEFASIASVYLASEEVHELTRRLNRTRVISSRGSSKIPSTRRERYPAA